MKRVLKLCLGAIFFINLSQVSNAQTVVIPDPTFRAFLKENYSFVLDQNERLVLSEANRVSNFICDNQKIKNVEGLQYFTNATEVTVIYTEVEELPDLSNLTKLRSLRCYSNRLKTLPDLSTLTQLEELMFSFNNISVVPDLSKNNLNHLDCSNNQIKEVPDIRHMSKLKMLRIGNNPLLTLPDISQNFALEDLDMYSLKLTDIPPLTHLPELKVLNLGANELTSVPDLSFNKKITQLFVGWNKIQNIPDLSPNTNLEYLDMHNNLLTSAPDLSSLTLLKGIYFDFNHIKEVPDLTSNTSLQAVHFSSNFLEHFPSVDHLKELSSLIIGGNRLTELPDLSQNTKLATLGVQLNYLTDIPDLTNTLVGKEGSTLDINDNFLTFEDLLPFIDRKFAVYNFADQRSRQEITEVSMVVNQAFEIDLNIDDTVRSNIYKWYKDDVLISTTNTNKFSISKLARSHSGTYRAEVTNPNVPGVLLIRGTPQLTVTDDASAPWEVVTAGPENHMVVIGADIQADINEKGIENNDYLGVFFKDEAGNLKCSDYVKWSGVNTSLTVWGSSVTPKNGFEIGENFIIKVWKSMEGKEYTVNATYDPNLPYVSGGFYTNNGFSRVISLKVGPVCQTIAIQNGWNLVSSFVKSDNLAMSHIFLNKNDVIVKNAAGEILYAPQFGITTGTWDILQGYMVYSSSSQSIEICGEKIHPQTSIPLVKKTYPVFLPFFGETESSASSSFAGLGKKFNYAQSLEYVNGETSLSAFNYIPEHVISPKIDMIGRLKPGLAYKVSLQEDLLFSYPANTVRRLDEPKGNRSALNTTHFLLNHKERQSNAVMVLPKSILDKLASKGDEFAFVDSEETIIGAGVYENENLAITIWENKQLLKDQNIRIKYWDSETGKELFVEATYALGSERFRSNTLNIISTLRTSNEENNSTIVYPNPTTGIVNFDFHLKNSGTVQINLTTVMGEQIQLMHEKLLKGQTRNTFDLGSLGAGQYIYQIIMPGETITNKIIIK